MSEVNEVVLQDGTWMEDVKDDEIVENPFLASNAFRDYFRTFSGNSEMRGEVQNSMDKVKRNLDQTHVDLAKARRMKSPESLKHMADIRMQQGVLSRYSTQLKFYDTLLADLDARLAQFKERLLRIGFSKQRVIDLEQCGISGTSYQPPRNCL